MPMEVNDPSKNIVQNVLFPSEFGSILTSYSKWLPHTHSTKRNWENLHKKLHKCEGTFTRTRNKVQGNITLVKKRPAMLHVYFWELYFQMKLQ